jgi:gamma-glutamyltranspeptidase/glutathione hydrolase
MVAAAHPDAVEAGLAVLRRGGDAIDAAIAVQATLSLVEPQSSGIAGGAFMLRFDAETGEVTVYDGRETAPASTREDRFLGDDGEPLAYVQAWRSGLSTGVPGAIAMFALAHEEHGARPWAENFQESILLAETGFAVAPRLNDIAARMAQFTDIEETGAAADYLFDENGEAFPIGHVLTNDDYADSLRAIAADWRNFYTGEIAQGIVEAVNQAPRPGGMTLEDLAGYEAIRRDAICGPYRSYQICSAPPPSSGAVAQNAILGMLSHFDMAAAGPTAEGWHIFIEASRLAYADRDRYVADPAFADVPTFGLIDPDYLRERAALIDPAGAMESAAAGTPPGAPVQPQDTTDDAPGTSHFVVVDADGDVVSITTTVESPFGSGRMTGGFFLNNQLTDFARDPRDEAGTLLPNAPAPGKRPRSSMSPTIVLNEDGDFVFATGSPGGNSIIAYVAKTLVAMIDWGMSPQEAAALPNVVARGDVVRIERGFDEAMLAELTARGFSIDGERGENSGIHIVRVKEDGSLEGGADPRRDGVALEP